MTRGRFIRRGVAWPVLAASAGVLAATPPAGAASEQELFLNLTHALQRAADMSAGRSVTPTVPEVFTPDFSLLGVVIAWQTRLALIQRAGGSELLPLGASLGGYRLTNIEEQHVTLQSLGGEHVVLRLQTGGGAGGEVTPPTPAGRVEVPKPIGSGAPNWAELVRAKEERSARQTQRDADEKARALREREIRLP